MANMSYCRFYNTLHDLQDCQSAIEDFIQNEEDVISSEEERRCAKRLIETCREIAENFEESDIDRVFEALNQDSEEED